jgi:signal transduction histidine kinase
MHVRDAATGALVTPEAWPGARALRGEVVTAPGADIRVRAFDGRELEMSGLAHEREEAHANEVAAHEASRRMEAFLATAAHDLRTPLAALVGYLDLAERQTTRLAAAAQDTSTTCASCATLAPRVEAVHASVVEADQGAERLARLLTLLFDTSAIRTGKLELHRAKCDLAALVREQVAALRMAAPDRTIRLHSAASGEESIVVDADADRICQVVTNYLTNALKNSPPDRPVDVRIMARGSRVRVAVCDQGQGIPKEECRRVWELFYRVSGVKVQDKSPHGKGSLGLGLHVCKALITAHGGRVGVNSAVGKGSTFWFTLPLSSPRSGSADSGG